MTHNYNISINPVVRAAASLIALLAASASLAEGPVLEEVIVTAQQRSQSVQDIPVSASALMGEGLQKQGISRMEEMTGTVPNLTINKGAFTNVINIRGVASGLNQGFEQSVGMFVDGIYMGRGQQMRIPFMDLERVEILRGAQSVLFGKNTIAGAISMHSTRPGDDFEGRLDASYDPEYGTHSAEVGVSVPLGDSLGLRLAYRRGGSDGYMDNLVDDTNTPWSEEESARLGLQWDISENLQVYLKYQQSTFDTKGRNWEVVLSPSDEALAIYGEDDRDYRHSISNNTGPLVGTDFAFEFSDNNSRNAALQIDYAVDAGTWTLISGYSAYDYHEMHDADWSPQAWIAGDEREDFAQYSQEIRFVSAVGERFDYILGAYAQTSDLEYDEIMAVPYFGEVDVASSLAATDLGLPPGTLLFSNASSQVTGYDRRADTASAFGQVSWRMTEALQLTVGARYVYSETEASHNLFVADLFGNAEYQPEGVDIGGGIGLGPRGADVTLVVWDMIGVEPHRFDKEMREAEDITAGANLQYTWSDDVMSYIRYDKGIKDGGFDPRSVSADPEDFEFQEEMAETVELGVKTTLAGGAAELNVAAFYSQMEDRQVSVFNGGLAFEVSNAGEAESHGVEIDGRWLLTERLMATAALGYIDFEWVKYTRAGCAPSFKGSDKDNGDGTCDLSGETTFGTPELTGFLALDHYFMLSDGIKFASRLSLKYRDDAFVNPGLDPLLVQEAYTLVDLRLALQDIDDDWELALLATNVTDENTMQAGTVIPLSEDTAGGIGAYVATINPPRAISVQGRLRF